MLEIKGFSKIYKGAQVYSAKNISLTVHNGEVCGLVGSNGAGKSTLIKSIVGIQPFQEGSIQVDGADIVKQPEKAKRRIGYVPDDHTVYDKLTGREYVDYMGSIYGATRAMKEDVLKNLAEYFSIGYALDMQIANYSHGMKQKICILGSLVHRPALWVLDEPMVGLDPQTMEKLVGLIRSYANKGNTVLFSSHNLDVVQKVCDTVAFIRHGELISFIDLRTVGLFDLDYYYKQVNRV